MINNDGVIRPMVDLKIEKKCLCQTLEMEMISASALLAAKTLLDDKNSDYVLGFINGYVHCLNLGESFDFIKNKDQGV